MKNILLVVIFLFINGVSFSELKFEDVDKNHWAYESIENLVKKGIIEEETFRFEGTKPISRYQFAYELSKALDKIELSKVDKIEIDVLKSIIVDFSDELNKIGYDRKSFEEKLNISKLKVEELEEEIKISKIKIKLLEEKLNKIEKELNLD